MAFEQMEQTMQRYWTKEINCEYIFTGPLWLLGVEQNEKEHGRADQLGAYGWNPGGDNSGSD